MTALSTAAIPTELREREQWVLWKREVRKGEETKVPYSITGMMADSTNSSTWTEFDTALAHVEGYAGIGYVFSNVDPFCGVDLDDCLDAAGQLDATAQKIVDAFSTYTEISPSGTGVKFWIRAKKHTRRCKTGIIWANGTEGMAATVVIARLPRVRPRFRFPATALRL